MDALAASACASNHARCRLLEYRGAEKKQRRMERGRRERQTIEKR
jgi:hypothetical protein